MTEDEAKTKWCPHMFPYTEGQKSAGHNCYADDLGTFHNQATKCIASKCMAWQIDGGFVVRKIASNSYEEERFDGGYCGLAGKP